MSTPIVFVGIDANSRLQVLQTPGVRVVSVDQRVDPVANLWPEPDADEFPDILARINSLPLMSPGSDDQVRSALHAIRRIRAGFTLIAGPVLRSPIAQNAEHEDQGR